MSAGAGHPPPPPFPKEPRPLSCAASSSIKQSALGQLAPAHWRQLATNSVYIMERGQQGRLCLQPAFTLNYIKWRLRAAVGWAVAGVIVSSQLLQAIFSRLPDPRTDSSPCPLTSVDSLSKGKGGGGMKGERQQRRPERQAESHGAKSWYESFIQLTNTHGVFTVCLTCFYSQDRLRHWQGSMQNETVTLTTQKLFSSSKWWQQSTEPSAGSFWAGVLLSTGALCNHTCRAFGSWIYLGLWGPETNKSEQKHLPLGTSHFNGRRQSVSDQQNRLGD